MLNLPPARRRSATLALATAAGLAALGCTIPTDVPRWNTVWQVPADSADVTVASLLPSAVSVVDIGGGAQAFSLSLPAASVTTTLGTACPGCAAANGQRAPKPAFILADSTTVAMPADVASADIIGGTIDYTMLSTFSFDPLNPSATALGWVRIRVTSGGVVVASDSISGATMSLPRNVTRARSMAIQASAAAPIHVAGPLNVVTTVYSPAGDSVTINTSEQFTVSAAANNVRVSQLSINVPGKSLAPQTSTVDLSGMDVASTGTLQGGAVILTVRNPFTVQGTVNVDFSAPDGTHVTKNVSLPLGGPSTAPASIRIALTQAEINSLVGKSNVGIALGGSVNAPGGPVTVTPTQKITIRTMVEATIATGGN